MNKIILIISIFIFAGCNSSTELNNNTAKNLVTNYLTENPIYETGELPTKKIRINSQKDKTYLKTLQKLNDQEFINLIPEKKRKKLFSKDSILIFSVEVLEKSFPYVVKQKSDAVVVKTIHYQISDVEDISFESKSDNKATFHVILTKEKTPFYYFGKGKQPNSGFITQKFKAKKDKEGDWYLID